MGVRGNATYTLCVVAFLQGVAFLQAASEVCVCGECGGECVPAPVVNGCGDVRRPKHSGDQEAIKFVKLSR